MANYLQLNLIEDFMILHAKVNRHLNLIDDVATKQS